jgi:uncharacterized membrane protein YfcA
MHVTNRQIRWVFVAILSYLGFRMILRGLGREGILPINPIERNIVAIVFASVIMTSLYFAFEKRYEDTVDYTIQLYRAQPENPGRIETLFINITSDLLKYGVFISIVLLALGIIMLFIYNSGMGISLSKIGGEPINMLALYWAAGLPIKVASATSNLIVGVTAATSGSLYWLFGFIQPFMAMVSIIGIAIGANISTHMLPRVKGPTIKALLLAIFSFLAYRMLLTGLRRGNIFMMPSTIENITIFLVLVISLAILMALRKYISE